MTDPSTISMDPAQQPASTSPPKASDNDVSAGFPWHDMDEIEQARCTTAKIMIVDDEPFNLKVVERYLYNSGYRYFVTVSDSTKALAQIRQEVPDIVLLDIMMPEVSGIDILRGMRAEPAIKEIPVIILSASSDPELKKEALMLRASDFLNKPVDPLELLPRIRNSLIVKAHQDHLANYAKELEETVRLRTAELAASRQDVILCLARAAEFRDNETGNHVIRVGRYVGIIAQELGYSDEKVDMLEQAAQLHDVGKIGIPDSILLKPGKLDPEEYAQMQKHASFGRQIIQRVPQPELDALRRHTDLGARLLEVVNSPIIELASKIALTHHEKWDGSGYPLGLAGDDIPVEGRMTAVADVYDALSSKRPYKEAFPRKKCFEIMEGSRGKQFDPKMLDAFFRRRKDIARIQVECADAE